MERRLVVTKISPADVFDIEKVAELLQIYPERVRSFQIEFDKNLEEWVLTAIIKS